MRADRLLSMLLLQNRGKMTSRELAQTLEAAASQHPPVSANYLSQRIHVDGAGWHPSDESYPLL
jgi:hypothetical protein